MSKFAALWYWRDRPLAPGWWRVESFSTDEQPKSTTVTGGPRPSSAPAFSWADFDDEGRWRVGMTHAHLPEAPPLWWVLIHENNGIARTVSLIGVADERHPDGTVIPIADMARGEPRPQQACAIRWGFGDPQVLQLHVDSAFRRRRVSIKAIHAADILNEAAGWGGYLYGGADLTPDGAKLAEAWTLSHRLQRRTGYMPSAENVTDVT